MCWRSRTGFRCARSPRETNAVPGAARPVRQGMVEPGEPRPPGLRGNRGNGDSTTSGRAGRRTGGLAVNDYAYVEEIDEDHVRVWPLTDSELTWNGEKVLTRKDGFTLEIEMCLGYEKGNPGYYVVETDELPEVCMLESPISGTSVGSKRSKTWRKELRVPEGRGGLEGALRDKAYSHDFDLLEVEPKRLCWGGEGLDRWIENGQGGS